MSRQNMPTLDRTKYGAASGVAQGPYVVADADGGKKAEVILMATGTELGMAVEAFERLKKDGVAARVVSMPGGELFEEEDGAYGASVLPPDVTARVSVEMAGTCAWHKCEGRIG